MDDRRFTQMLTQIAADRKENNFVNYIGVIGSRELPLSWKEKVQEVVRNLLAQGYGIASGGAMGADSFALEEVIRSGKSFRGIVFSAWDGISGFPYEVRDQIKEFARKGGRIDWGTVYQGAPRKDVVAGLFARNRKLAENITGLVAFAHGEAHLRQGFGGQARGTMYTVREAMRRGKPAYVFQTSADRLVKLFRVTNTATKCECNEPLLQIAG